MAKVSSLLARKRATVADITSSSDTRCGRGWTDAGAISGILPTPWSAVTTIVIVVESRSA